MGMTASQLDTWLKDNAVNQLQTFDKTITCTASVYRQSSTNDSGTYYGSGTARFHQTGASSSVFNGDMDGGIGTGLLIESNDIASSIVNTVRSAVDAIEGSIGDFTIDARVCHNSCHSSCHSSRGRR
jgi:hypothetical protein